jgi:hypothetical protein
MEWERGEESQKMSGVVVPNKGLLKELKEGSSSAAMHRLEPLPHSVHSHRVAAAHGPKQSRREASAAANHR